MKSTIALTGIVYLLLMTFGCSKKDHTSPPSNGTPDLTMITDGLISPIMLVEPPDSSHRLFIVDETGKIWIIGADGKKLATPFIDMSGKMVSLSPGYDERGLL